MRSLPKWMKWPFDQDSKPSPKPQAAPKAPSMDNANAAALSEANRKRRAAARSQSIQTSPLGYSGESSVAKKMLLGE